jgi:hypothetical protein
MTLIQHCNPYRWRWLPGIKVTIPPQNPSPLVLPVMLFSNVVTARPYTSADSVHEDGLQVSSG